MNSTTEMASKPQTWALFCITRIDWRPLNLTRAEASEAIDALKNGKPLPSRCQTYFDEHGGQNNSKAKVDFAAIHTEAHQAGMAAAGKAVLQPFNVRNDLTGDISPGAPDLCGFAWVNFHAKSGLNRQFANWAKEQNLARKDDYYGGYTIWIGEFGQSVNKKEAYAAAYAATLGKHGIKASYRSRLD